MGQRRPPAWAYHAYSTINRLTDSRIKAFVQATRARRVDGTDVSPNIWLTEQGGLLRVRNRVYDNPENRGAQRQQRAVRYLVGNPDSGNEGLINRYSRISRVYYYSWRGDLGFDSGLASFRKSMPVRPAYYCLRYATNPRDGDRTKCQEDL